MTIDRSSWVSWAAYGLAFELALALCPGMADDLKAGGQGLAVILGGVALFFAAVVVLQRHMRLALQAAHYGAPAELVTDGVFRYSRNPIYLAFLMPLATLAVYSPVAALIGIAGYLAAMTGYVISREERDLANAFPTAFAAYRAATPRWLFV